VAHGVVVGAVVELGLTLTGIERAAASKLY
jgi:hypothetical protein